MYEINPGILKPLVFPEPHLSLFFSTFKGKGGFRNKSELLFTIQRYWIDLQVTLVT